MSCSLGHKDSSRQHCYANSVIGTVPQQPVDIYIVNLILTLQSKMSYLTSWVWGSLGTHVFICIYQFITEVKQHLQAILKRSSILHSEFCQSKWEAEMRYELVGLVAGMFPA